MFLLRCALNTNLKLGDLMSRPFDSYSQCRGVLCAPLEERKLLFNRAKLAAVHNWDRKVAQLPPNPGSAITRRHLCSRSLAICNLDAIKYPGASILVTDMGRL